MTNLIGLAELAELYGVSKNTANTWARRHDWPSPVANLKMGPVWDRETILQHKPLPEQNGYSLRVNCAWCCSTKFDDIDHISLMSTTGRTMTCGECGKVSVMYFVSDCQDSHNLGLSLKVVKKEYA